MNYFLSGMDMQNDRFVPATVFFKMTGIATSYIYIGVAYIL